METFNSQTLSLHCEFALSQDKDLLILAHLTQTKTVEILNT